MQDFRRAYREYCGQLDIAPLYELTEDQMIEAGQSTYQQRQIEYDVARKCQRSNLITLNCHRSLWSLTAMKQGGHCNLQACRISTSDVIALAQTMKFHPLIHSLDLRDNNLDDMAALGIAEAISTTGYPTSVDLRKNAVTDVGAQALLDAAKGVPMVALNLEGNQLSPDLLSQIQSFIAQRKKAPAAAPVKPAPAAAVPKRLQPRSSYEDDDLRRDPSKKKKPADEDEDMDLGFDSEIRGRKTPTSPSESRAYSKKFGVDTALNDSTTSPIPVAAAAAPVAAAASPSSAPPRRSSFSEALRAANEDARGVDTTDFGEEEFDWNAADTGDLLDTSINQGAPELMLSMEEPLVKKPEFVSPPAASGAAKSAAPVPAPTTVSAAAAAAPSVPVSAPTPLTKVPSLPPAAAAAAAAASSSSTPAPLAPLSVPEPTSSPADQFDEFDFDDSSHFDHDAPAPAPAAAVPVASSVAKRSFPPTPQGDGLLERAELVSGPAPTVEDDWSKGVGFGGQARSHASPDSPKAGARHPSTAAATKSIAPSSSSSSTSAVASPSSSSSSGDFELQQAQAKMRASIEASHALAKEAEVAVKAKQPTKVLPAPAAATTTTTQKSNTETVASSSAASTPKSRVGKKTTAPAPAAAAAPIPAPVQSQPVYVPEFTAPPPPPPPVARPTLLPPSPELWNTDPNDSASTRIDLSGPPMGDLKAVLGMYHSLRSLTLSQAGLTELPPLPPTLEQLDIAQNNLRSFAGLQGLKRLLELNAAGNELKTMDGLPSSIRLLNLSNSGLRVVSGLAHLKHLQLLDLRMNLLPSVTSLRELSVNSSLRVLRVQGNPFISQFPNTPQRSQAAGLKSALSALLPSLVQVDAHVLVLNPADILGAAAARGGASLLMDADLLDVVDLHAAITAHHGPQVKRLLARLQAAGDKASSGPTVLAASSASTAANGAEPSVLITAMLQHLLQLAFVPYFLPELEAKVLLSLLSHSSPPRISTAAFIEFIARAACFKLHGLPVATPAVIRTYAKQLREQAMSEEGLFEYAYLNDIFFTETDSPSKAWVYANYAIKLLGLIIRPPTPGHPSSSFMRLTTAATSRASPVPPPIAAAASPAQQHQVQDS